MGGWGGADNQTEAPAYRLVSSFKDPNCPPAHAGEGELGKCTPPGSNPSEQPEMGKFQ